MQGVETVFMHPIYNKQIYTNKVSCSCILCCPGQRLSVSHCSKNNNSKVRQGRIIVLMHCTSTQCDLSTYRVSC